MLNTVRSASPFIIILKMSVLHVNRRYQPLSVYLKNSSFSLWDLMEISARNSWACKRGWSKHLCLDRTEAVGRDCGVIFCICLVARSRKISASATPDSTHLLMVSLTSCPNAKTSLDGMLPPPRNLVFLSSSGGIAFSYR